MDYAKWHLLLNTYKMSAKNISASFLAITLASILFYVNGIFALNNPQSRSFIHYVISDMGGWYYKGESANGDSYIFQNNSQKITVNLIKKPLPCENPQEFNRVLLGLIQDLSKTQEFVEQRKPSVPYSFLEQRNGHLLIVKSRATGARRFILAYHIGAELYRIEIKDATELTDPSGDALSFIARIRRGDGTGAPPVPDPPPIDLAQQKQTAPGSTTAISRNPAHKQTTDGATRTEQSTKEQFTQQSAKNTTRTESVSGKSITPIDWQIKPAVIETGSMPDVKFVATDPCAAGGDKDGLPWQKGKPAEKIDLPKGVEAASPPIIPDLKSLSQATYNAAVSTAFEAMRLLYGPMSDQDARKFEAVWVPLFDYPTQEVIDYLNKLNPLVSQFLVCREAYVRNLNDIQIVMFDAALAIEAGDQMVWENVMAEAALYTSSLQSIEVAMKNLANQIDAMGNPPNPNTAKCEAQRRYKTLITQQDDLECISEFDGVWVGYSEGHDWDEFLPRKPVLLFFYSMPFKNPFLHGKQTCSTIGMYQRHHSGYDLEWANQEISAWDAPVARFYFSRAIEEGLTVDKTSMRYSYIEKGHGEDYKISVVLQKVAGTLPPPDPGTDAQRLEELKAIKDSLEAQMKSIPPKYSEGLDLSEANGFGQAYKNWRASKEFQKLADRVYWCKFNIDKLAGFLEGRPIIHAAAQYWMNNLPYGVDVDVEVLAHIVAFTKIAQAIVAGHSVEKANIKRDPPPATTNTTPNQTDEAAKESITFHLEMVNLLKINLEREAADRDKAWQDLGKAKTPAEAENIARRIKEFDLRIINLQSNIQSEQDLADSYKTGQLIRTRTAFDDYAHSTFIDNIRENAARMDATRRIAERINRQIELLPWELRAAAREQASRVLDAKTVASGDIEKARKFAQTVTNQVQGYAEFDHAKAKEAEVNAEQNEFYAQMTIVAAGAGAIGFGSAALVEAFGAQSAAAIYGAKALGAIYGGTTGMIAGGPKEGITQAVSYWSPMGYAATQFVDGFQKAGYQKDATLASQVWEGAQQAGSAWLMGKAFEFGTSLVVKGSLKYFGSESRLFKPVVNTPAQRAKQVLEYIRTQQKLLNAQDEINTFKQLESQLSILKRDPVANASKISQMEKELNQLAAGLNMSYFTKWNLKYKADPLTRSKFDRRVQQNYSEMTPGMKNRLEQQGYDMDGIDFVQFRNANSGGTSSMDMDLVPVRAGTKAEPALNIDGKKMVRKKDGSLVSLEQFNDDAQKAMNLEYRQKTGLSAPASDMNLVTSVHKEAFATPRLLEKGVDFSTFTPDEIASVGKVLEVKMAGIDKNKMLTNTAKMQAKCREATKEVENMLIPKLKSDLNQAPKGSIKEKQLRQDIEYWEDMLRNLKKIGTEEINPMEIMRINREITQKTGGSDVNVVVADVARSFGKK